MKLYSNLKLRLVIFAALLIIIPKMAVINAQSIEIGVHADPSVGWFSSDNSKVTGKGINTGFNFGVTLSKNFQEHYAFSTGLNLITAGGSLTGRDTTIYELKNSRVEVLPESKVVYKIKYLAIPVGIRLRSNEIGYITLFMDIGLDPKFVLGGKIEVPSQHIAKENANKELKGLCVGYHVIGGIEYSLGGSTSIVLGFNFDSNFTDITKENNTQPTDKILHKMLGLRLGLNF